MRETKIQKTAGSNCRQKTQNNNDKIQQKGFLHRKNVKDPHCLF